MPAIAFFPFSFPGLDGSVRCVFTTRQGGISRGPYAGANLSYEVGDAPEAVAANRRALAGCLGLDRWCECRQIHGDRMHVDPEPLAPLALARLEGDGLATSSPRVGLTIKTADCQPLFLAHASGRYIAALHVGWRGNVLRFPVSGVVRFCEAYGLDPAEIHAVRGPSLGPAAAEFTHFATEFGPAFNAYYDPVTRTVDLWALTRDQLVEAGLRPEHIHGLDQCTFAHPDRFFSHRREPAGGRQMGIIWISG